MFQTSSRWSSCCSAMRAGGCGAGDLDVQEEETLGDAAFSMGLPGPTSWTRPVAASRATTRWSRMDLLHRRAFRRRCRAPRPPRPRRERPGSGGGGRARRPAAPRDRDGELSWAAGAGSRRSASRRSPPSGGPRGRVRPAPRRAGVTVKTPVVQLKRVEEEPLRKGPHGRLRDVRGHGTRFGEGARETSPGLGERLLEGGQEEVLVREAEGAEELADELRLAVRAREEDLAAVEPERPLLAAAGHEQLRRRALAVEVRTTSANGVRSREPPVSIRCACRCVRAAVLQLIPRKV